MTENSELNEESGFSVAIYGGHVDLESYFENYETGVDFFKVTAGAQMESHK